MVALYFILLEYAEKRMERKINLEKVPVIISFYRERIRERPEDVFKIIGYKIDSLIEGSYFKGFTMTSLEFRHFLGSR